MPDQEKTSSPVGCTFLSLCGEQNDYLRRASETWRQEQAGMLRALLFKMMAEMDLTFATLASPAVGSAWQKVKSGEETDYPKLGRFLLDWFDAQIDRLSRMAEEAVTLTAAGYDVPAPERLRAAKEELVALRAEVQERWPWFTRESAEQGLAEYRRGECADLDAALVPPGADKAAWLERVERRAREFAEETIRVEAGGRVLPERPPVVTAE